jgi:hypothetical protein
VEKSPRFNTDSQSIAQIAVPSPHIFRGTVSDFLEILPRSTVFPSFVTDQYTIDRDKTIV